MSLQAVEQRKNQRYAKAREKERQLFLF